MNKIFITLDQHGTIAEVHNDVSNNFVLGNLFAYAFGPDNTNVLLELIRSLNGSEHIVFCHCELEDVLYLVAGYKRDSKYYMTVVPVLNNRIVNELAMINSESVNKIRSLEKKLTVKEAQTSQEMFEEISRLNNELINTQRQLAKLNVELVHKNEQLNRISVRDSLTGLYNRLYLKQKFEEICKLQARLHHKISIVMIDLNKFKVVNDTYGHEEGDFLLKTFADVGNLIIRKDFDYFFRIGGDEFLLIMVDCSSEEAENVCIRINNAFIKHTTVSSISYGISPLDVDKESSLAFYLADADEKMYAYKKEFKLKEKTNLRILN